MLIQVNQLFAQLNGNYTIDRSKPVSSRNYHSFISAINDLDYAYRADSGTVNGPGVSGPVVFNVADGIYQGNFIIPYIKGDSTINTLTFQSASGDSSKVILVDSVADSDYIVELNAAQYVTLKQLSFVRPNGGDVIYLYSNSNHINLVSDVFNAGDNISSAVMDDHNYGERNTFSNNYFINAANGIDLVNTSGILDSDIVIQKNTFGNVNNAIFINQSRNLIITDNKISCTSNANNENVIDLETVFGPALIKNNIIDIKNNALLRGITIEDADPPFVKGAALYDSLRILIADNVISFHDTSTRKEVIGLFLNEDRFTDAVYNSVFIDSTSSYYAQPLYFNVNDSNNRILNNDFVNVYGKYVVNFDGYSFDYKDTLDYNNYYARNGLANQTFTNSTASYSIDYNTLESLVSFDNCDRYSISVLPSYVNTQFLYPNSYILHGRGTPFPSVTDDIDGKPRNKVHPDIGAYELDTKYDLGLGNIQSPDSVICNATPSVKAGLILTNYGDNIERNVAVHYKIAGTVDTGVVYVDTAVYYNGSDTFQVVLPLNIQVSGKYKVQVYISLDSDKNRANDTVNYYIQVVSAPKPSFKYSMACVNKPVPFVNTTKGDPAVSKYIWNFGDGDTSNEKNPIPHVFTYDTTYIVTLESFISIGCTDTTSLVVKPLPLTYSSFSFESTGPLVQFMVDDSLFKQYEWNFGDGGTSDSLNPSHYYSQDNIYIVTLYVTNANGCIDSVQDLVEIVDAGLNPQKQDINSFSVYPDPFSDYTVVHCHIDQSIPAQMVLYNSYGQVIKKMADGSFPEGDYSYVIDARALGLSPGVYYVRFSSGSNVETKQALYLK